jgi:tetratricopeptide (TPR) repeat protein
LSRSADEDAAFTRAETLGVDEALGEAAGTDESTYVKTRLGTILGTAGYMSPEQARGEAATAASDMYSVGLILQEMFTGVRPFEEGLTGEELVKKAAGGDTLPPTGLSSDLTELITRLKSVAPGARPSSVDALDQMQRIVDKPKRRRKRTLVAAVWIILGLLATGMFIQSVRASKQAELAQREAATSEEVTEFLIGLFRVSDPGEARGNTITAREILDKGADDVEEELADQPEVQARMKGTIGEVYTNLGFYNEAERLLEGALEIQRDVLGGEHPETLRSLNRLANAFWYQQRYGEAEPLYLELVEGRTRVLGEAHPDTLTAQYDLASCYIGLEKYEEMEELSLRTLDVQKRTLGEDHPDTLATLGNLASLYYMQRRYEESLQIQETVFEKSRQLLGEDHPQALLDMHNLATNYEKLGRFEEAEPLFVEAIDLHRRVLGDPHPETAQSIRNLGLMYKIQERFEEAEFHLLEAWGDFKILFGQEHGRSLQLAADLAELYEAWGRADEAAKYRAILPESEQSTD